MHSAVSVWCALTVAAVVASPKVGAALQVGDILSSGSAGIVRIDPVSGAASPFSTFRGNVVADLRRGVYAVATDTIVSLDVFTGTSTPVSSGGLLGALTDIELGPNGSLIVAGSNGIVRVDASTGAQTFLSDGGEWSGGPPSRIAIGADGNIYALGQRLPEDPFFARPVLRVDPISGLTSFVGTAWAGSCSGGPSGWASGPGGNLYWAEPCASGLRAMDPETGEVSSAGASLDYTLQTDIAVDPNGDLLTVGFILEPADGGPTRWAIGRTRTGPGGTYSTTAVADPLSPDAVGPITVVVPEGNSLLLTSAGVILLGLGRVRLRTTSRSVSPS